MTEKSYGFPEILDMIPTIGETTVRKAQLAAVIRCKSVEDSIEMLSMLGLMPVIEETNPEPELTFDQRKRRNRSPESVLHLKKMKKLRRIQVKLSKGESVSAESIEFYNEHKNETS